MLSLKGIVKYIFTIFIAAWMFVLGVIVGRGNSPVTFDTRGFEQQLGSIAGSVFKKKEKEKEVDLEFFEVLDQPVAEERGLPEHPLAKVDPKAELETSGNISVKTSTKKRTFQKKKTSAPEPAISVSVPDVPVKKAIGQYTIQVAAFKDVKDALTQMTALEKKGVKSYREKDEKDGVIWYRVRTGEFHSFEDAKKFKEKLNRIKITAMIIKKG